MTHYSAKERLRPIRVECPCDIARKNRGEQEKSSAYRGLSYLFTYSFTYLTFLTFITSLTFFTFLYFALFFLSVKNKGGKQH